MTPGSADPSADLTETGAERLDRADTEHSRRERFLIPPAPGGDYPQSAYLAGNSLGLQPRVARERVEEVLAGWADISGSRATWKASGRGSATTSCCENRLPRWSAHGPAEVVAMNSLTVNLHLMMISFYRPTTDRHAIVVEDATFPSDGYAVRSQAALHGYDPDTAVIRLRPRTGERALRSADVLDFLAEHGDRIALVLLGGVNYLSGELLDIPAITAAGRAAGAVVGWDLAHAVGNVPLRLHDWGVDWAAWCSYKYLNAGPGRGRRRVRAPAAPSDRTIPRWPAGGATTRRPGSRCADSTRLHTATPGSCPTRRSSRWRRCWRRWRCRRGRDAMPAGAQRPAHRIPQAPARRAWLAAREGSRRHTAGTVLPGAQLSVRGGRALRTSRRRTRHEHGVIADVRVPDVIRLAPIAAVLRRRDCWRAPRWPTSGAAAVNAS